LPRRHFTLFLLKDSVATGDDALRPRRPGESAPLRRELSAASGIDGILFLQKPTASEPDWVPLLRPYVPNLPNLQRKRASAVLLLHESQRWFAATFGHGRLLLDPAKLEPNFGLKVVVNSVDADSLRSVDAQSLEELSLATSARIGRDVAIFSFGIDLERDIVRGLAGSPPAGDPFAAKLAGATALAIDADMSVPDLPDKCADALRRSGDTKYKARFGWMDNIRLVSDSGKITDLDNEIDALIAANATDEFILALPEVVDDDKASRFEFSTSNLRHDDLRWDDYAAEAVASGALSVQVMRTRDRVIAIDTNGLEDNQWPVYDCLSVELRQGNAVYVLVSGEWYEVSATIAARARLYVEDLEVGAPTFIPYDAAFNDEADYNAALVASFGAGGALLLDKNNIRAAGAQDVVELADVLEVPGRLIHVKRHARSSMLSHLFMQGMTSADLLLTDDSFRVNAETTINQLAPGVSQAIVSNGFSPSNVQIVFAVIAAAGRGARHFLPFFSQLTCERVARQLKARGFDVKLTRVDPA
jgi:uncharacterized protein (TIGR04141 family)